MATASRLGWAALLLLIWSGAAHAEDRYYMMIFGSQRNPPNPDYSHTWAVFVRASAAGPDCPEGQVLESHTISWMSQSLRVRVFSVLPEPGTNLDLPTTFLWVLSTGQRVSMWGPFEINQELYCRAVKQVAHLESGEVRYKALDTGFPAARVSNCIHGVSDLSGNLGLRVLSPGWGEMASYFVVRELRRWICNPEQIHPWVATALGLDGYPMIRRDDLENPRSGAVWTGLRAVTGHSEPRTPDCGPKHRHRRHRGTAEGSGVP